jgi:hypothetical protein
MRNLTIRRIFSWFVWVSPIFVLLGAQQFGFLKSLRSTSADSDSDSDTRITKILFINQAAIAIPNHNESTYLIISKPQNSLTLAAIRQLSPALVYVAYPPSEKQHIAAARRKLKSSALHEEDRVKWCPFDPFGPKESVKNNARSCLEAIRTHVDAQLIDGILFNSYGAVGDGTANETTGLLPLVEYKLIGNLIFLNSVLDQDLLKKGARVIFVGSESARGLPKMGFPVPDLGSTVESIQSYLTGTSYIQQNNDHTTSSTYRWEQAYADLCAITIFYMRRLARDYPHIYFGAVSPGMTEESLNPDNSPSPSSAWRLQLFFFRRILFVLLKKWEIAKTVDEGAELLVRALLATKITQPTEFSWEYTSGTFVGAEGGTGGPICDQTILEGGKMYLEQHLQDLAYQAVQPYLP